jgi:hypothetical protein
MSSKQISDAQIFQLKIAARRPRGNIHPVLGLTACVADGLGMALVRRGLAEVDEGGILRIAEAGRRAAIAKAEGR